MNRLVADYNSTLSNLLSHHAPLKPNTVRKRPSVPWYTAEIDAAKRLRRKAERKWRRTGLHEAFIAFKSQRNRTTYLMNASRKTFYADFISDNSTDQGKLFRAAKKLLSIKEEQRFPNYSDKTFLVNDIADFFVTKIDTIHSNIDALSLSCLKDTVPEDFEIGPQKVLSSFKPLTEATICKLIQSSAKKSCALDPMPTPLVVSCLDVLLPVITTIVNSSFLHGHFPSNWKEAIVTPILKNPSLTSEFSNLRPISNTVYLKIDWARRLWSATNSHVGPRFTSFISYYNLPTENRTALRQH